MTTRVDHAAIRRIRRSLDLTQIELAVSIERSASWVSVLESGLGPVPDQQTVRKLALALSVPLTTIIGEEGTDAY